MGKMKMAAESALCILRISITDMIALRVRARGAANSDLPEFLYQALPASAMSLMATIPRGLHGISIPHQNEWGDGYPILNTPPPATDGFVIVYARQKNARYEAVNILFKGETFDIAGFHEIACRWMEKNVGSLETVRERYGYFSPGIDLWGAILRDNGYTALDPTMLASDITGKIRNRREGVTDSGVFARIPIRRGNRQSIGTVLPVFTKIELTLDPNPGPRTHWIGIPQYHEMRAGEACPPSSIITDFREWLARLTNESGYKKWVFRLGMLFGDHIEWWGDCNRRRTVHEGIDFVEGLTANEGIQPIPVGTPVHVMADGEIVACLDDFLGKTLVVRHPGSARENSDIFHTLYSHIRPVIEGLGPVAKGRLIGQVGKSTNALTPAHLHLAGAWIPRSIRPDAIGLEHINPGFAPVKLASFNDLLERFDNPP